MLPNFLIVGAMKGGTSSFLLDINEHPEVCVSKRELHFFNREERFSRGLDYYSLFFQDCNAKAIGEKTPTYSYHPKVADRIYRSLPKVRLIWILREPVARSYSHYNFFVARGKERLTFPKAIDRELAGKTKDFTMRYLDRSIYVKQIQNYLQYFNKEQMHFLLYEDYTKNREETLANTVRFLGLEPFQFPAQSKRTNLTFMPSSRIFQWTVYQLFRNKGYRLYNFFRKMNRSKTPGYPSMDASVYGSLKEYFQPHNAELSRITGLNLSVWK